MSSAPCVSRVVRILRLRPAATTRAAPRSFAACTATCPTAPVAPMISTDSPGLMLPFQASDSQAVIPAAPTPMASASESPVGTAVMLPSGTAAYSAMLPPGSGPRGKVDARAVRKLADPFDAGHVRDGRRAPDACGNDEVVRVQPGGQYLHKHLARTRDRPRKEADDRRRISRLDDRCAFSFVPLSFSHTIDFAFLLADTASRPPRALIASAPRTSPVPLRRRRACGATASTWR